ncbi:unnamed protein product, partial [Didymodactylos carnosus]
MKVVSACFLVFRSGRVRKLMLLLYKKKIGGYLFDGFTRRSWSIESGDKNDFFNSQLFPVFYLRMFTCIVLCGAANGHVYLPEEARDERNEGLWEILSNMSPAHTIDYNQFQIDGRSQPFEIEIIDSVNDYVELMKSIFDFDILKSLLNDEKQHFKIIINAVNGVMGPSTVKNCKPLEDFGSSHPDPNLTYAPELVEDIQHGDYDFGAAFDGDDDRNMILGKKFSFVTPCDSLALLAANLNVIPYFRTHGVSGYARSMPTSGIVDRSMPTSGTSTSDLRLVTHLLMASFIIGLVIVCTIVFRYRRRRLL